LRSAALSKGDHQREALTIDQIFSYRIRDARLSKQWSQQRLAAEMTARGWPISQQTITKIEAGAHGVGGEVHAQTRSTQPRRVSLAEAIAFAAVLDIPPPSLFLPLARDDDVQLTADLTVGVDAAHAWVRGEQPLDPSDEAFYRFQTFARKATVADLAQIGIRFVQESSDITSTGLSRAEFLGLPPVNPNEED
jgi:transcriptional regulator with XRE-family HTH domain